MSKNFVIISHQRTGSNMVRKALNKHSQVYCGSEIVEKAQDVSLIRNEMEQNKKPVFCFLLKYDQLTAYIADFLEKNDFKVIHLQRRNKLKAYISRMIGTGSNRQYPVVLDIKEAKTVIEYISFYESVFKERPTLDILDLFYEDITKSNSLPKALFDFMGIEMEKCEYEDYKLNPDSVKVTVSNYDDVAKAFPEYI